MNLYLYHVKVRSSVSLWTDDYQVLAKGAKSAITKALRAASIDCPGEHLSVSELLAREGRVVR